MIPTLGIWESVAVKAAGGGEWIIIIGLLFAIAFVVVQQSERQPPKDPRPDPPKDE